MLLLLTVALLAAALAGGASVLALLPADAASEVALALAVSAAIAPLLAATWVRWRLRGRRAASPTAWFAGFAVAAFVAGFALTAGERSPDDLIAALEDTRRNGAPPAAVEPGHAKPTPAPPPPAQTPPTATLAALPPTPLPARERFMAGTVPPHVRAKMRPRNTLRRMTPEHRARFAEARRSLEDGPFLSGVGAPTSEPRPVRPSEVLTDTDCPGDAMLYVFEDKRQQITTYSCRLPDLATRRHRCAPHGPTLARMVRDGRTVQLDLREWREGYEHGREVVWRNDHLVTRAWDRGQVVQERRYREDFRTQITHELDDGPVASVQIDARGDVVSAGRIEVLDGGFVLETVGSDRLRSARLCIPLFEPGSEHLEPGLHMTSPCLLAFTSRASGGRWRTEFEVYEREQRRRCIVESDRPSRAGRCEPDLDLGGQDEVPAVARRPIGTRALDHVDRPLQAYRLRSLARGIIPIDPGGAAELYETAIATDPRYDTWQVWLELAEAKRKWGDFPGAERALREAWRRKPDWDIVVAWLPLLRLQGKEEQRSALHALARRFVSTRRPPRSRQSRSGRGSMRFSRARRRTGTTIATPARPERSLPERGVGADQAQRISLHTAHRVRRLERHDHRDLVGRLLAHPKRVAE